MADQGKDSRKGGGFGDSLMTYIKSALPYTQPFSVIDNIEELNPKFKDFYDTGARRQEIINKQSVFTSKEGQDESLPVGGVAIDKNYHAFMYANVDHDKSKRLRDYRIMAQFAEVADALDEICDESINKDEKDRIVTLVIQRTNLNINIYSEIQTEFMRFVGLYELDQKGWEYFRQLLVDGEIYFEHIIHEKRPDAGILGIMSIPSDLVDPIYDNVQNLTIKGFLLRKPKIEKTTAGLNQSSNKPESVEYIPFDKNQITYVHSGIWNETKTLRMPFIENARRAYRQLSLIEDAIIIYRLVRAPERLIFNVDVGNMPPPKAEAYMKRMMQQYWSRKTYDSSQGKTVQAYNPQSMLDAFWFAKRQGSEGTSVTSLPAGKNLGELEDLKYFQQKLYKALKVPIQRLNTETSQADSQGATILREELKFARFVIRLQERFAQGIKEAFITHLKLKGLWDAFKLKEYYLGINFNAPTNFHEMRAHQIHELKWNNYSNATQIPTISDTYAKKTFLKMSDEEIQNNRELLRKDSALTWELAQIVAQGPNWRDAFQTPEPGAAPAGGGFGGGGGGGAAMGMPDFGPTPPAGGEAPVLPGGEAPPAEAAPAPAPGASSALPQ